MGGARAVLGVHMSQHLLNGTLAQHLHVLAVQSHFGSAKGSRTRGQEPAYSGKSGSTFGAFGGTQYLVIVRISPL